MPKAALHDVNVLDILPVEAGAFYVMGRGYLDFAWLYAMHQAGAFFVTRAKRGMDARRVYSAPAQRAAGADDCRPVQEPLAGRAVLQMDQAALTHQALPGAPARTR